MTKPAITIRDAMTDPQLFGGTFGSDTFAAWGALLAGFYGLPLTGKEAETFKALTGRSALPTEAHTELWLAHRQARRQEPCSSGAGRL